MNVYLVDDKGVVVHTWRSDRKTKGTTILLENGTLLRGRSGLSGQPDGVHLLDWNGSVLWDYQPPSGFSWHHDFEPLPNGNILINTMVRYHKLELIEWGRDPEITQEFLVVEPILEIKPNGTAGGDIVWKWDPLDHLIQDYDHVKRNFGVVKDHPELIDINYQPVDIPEWQHTNSVSYNAELDQIMITDRNFDEFWVIDHNTTMAEAANHTGGAHGKGGDILYRWGNPGAYGAGNDTNHILYGPHDAHWIGPGLPGEGNIIVFNNGENSEMTRPEGKFSTVEELVPPINATGGYDLAPGSAYGPSDPIWSYNANPPESFFAWAMGGVERLPNGNTLVCGGSTGYNFEVNSKDEIVWDYRSNSIFRVSRYYPPALNKIPDLIATEDEMVSVNIASFISDLDTDHEDLVISENSSYADVHGHELLLQYPDGITTDIIELTVSDGIFGMERQVRINITPVNDAPILAPIPDITATEAVPYTLDLEPFVSDPDTDIHQMKITVNSIFVTVEGGELRFLYPNGVLADRILLQVSDGEFEDWTGILVSVTPVNDPPIVDRIENQEGVEDVPWTIDLEMYIRDIDNPIEDISVASDSPYTSFSGLNLSLLYPEGVTRDVVSLTVSDGESDTVVEFNVIIEPVNDPPVIGDIPPLTLTEDVSFTLDLGPAIFDIDTPMEGLTLMVDSPFIDVEDHILILLYPDGIHEDEVVVEISDGDLLVSTALTVVVEPVDDPPVIGDIEPLTVTEDEPFTLDLGPAILDIDTPKEGLILRVDSPYIDVEDHILILLYPDGVHEDEVVVEIWDGDVHTSTTLVVNVEHVNDPPWWVALPDLAAVEDVVGRFDLDPYLSDIDTPHVELTVEADSSYGMVEDHVFIYVYPDGVLSEQVTFTLTDGEFQVVLRMNVTVSPVNDAPELSGASVDPPEGSGGTSFKFTVVLKDIDIGSSTPVVEVVIDGVKYRCARDELDNGRYDEGVVFFLERDLGSG
ncbi:MAG: aryl-sulfate sulfotransferase, partial [Thermoplasmata archaeon]|nr:aryl-sulfate sulfotransferase [Thermoplasmata archaeon]